MNEVQHPWIERRRRLYERFLVGVIVAGPLLIVAGGVLSNLALAGARTYGSALSAAGLLAIALSMPLSLPIQTLRTVGLDVTDGARYDRSSRWLQLRAVSVTLNILAFLCGGALLVALLNRMGVFDFAIPTTLFLRVSAVLMGAIAANHAASHLLSMRIPIERGQYALAPAFFLLGMAGTVTLGLLAVALLAEPLHLFDIARLRSDDASYFVLGGLVFAAFTLFIARSLPTVYALFALEKEFVRGRYMSRAKSVLMPAMVAFALLFLVVFLVLVFGIGLAGVAEETRSSSVLLGVLVLLVVAMVGSVAVATMLSKSEDKVQLFQKKITAEQRRGYWILGVSGTAAAALFFTAALLKSGVAVPGFETGWWVDLVAAGLLCALGPYGFYVGARLRRIKRLEERFPDFLRDLASSTKAGLTLSQSAVIAAKGEYGDLSPEIQKLADQLSWNVSFDESLQKFGERVDTPLVQRAVSLITEASRSGGHVTDVLMAAARDVREIKNLENERSLTMTLYTVIIYITFFVFLGVAVVLYDQFVPEILRAGSIGRAQGSTGFAGVSFAQIGLADYRQFYFLAGIMQGLGNGIVAGLMGAGRALSGLRHSFAMVLLTWIVFALVL